MGRCIFPVCLNNGMDRDCLDTGGVGVFVQ
jgi:hypothetical protein